MNSKHIFRLYFMSNEFAMTIKKKQAIAAPFRRQFYEPYDHIVYNPISNQVLQAPANNTPENPVPIYIENGQNVEAFYKLSDIKIQIETELKKKEEEIREKFLEDLKKELIKNSASLDQDSSNENSSPSNQNDLDQEVSKYIF